ncbi:MAG: hypothetical protein GX617_17315 [Lentisphaerae bacterium]|nr:hypothetical protein [Lentisphaerota bacterium]
MLQVMFQTLPKTAEEFISMPEFGFTTPFQVAALFIAAICAYPENRDECYNMIDALKGPQKLSVMEKQFIRDRMMGKAGYIGKAYFTGATPENNYTPDRPYTVVVEEDPYTYAEAGYAKVFIRTSGADSPRPVKLRKKEEQWFLWEHAGLLSDIRRPRAQDPWA